MSRKPWRRRLFRAAGVLMGALVGVAAAELLGRALDSDVFLQQRMRAGGVLVPYVPHAQADLLADEFRVRFAINQHGYRDRVDRTLTRVPDRARVLLLGDSFSVGWGVEFEETFGALLEDRLQVDVVNASASGGCPLWYLAQARAAVPRFTPDLVLVQIYDNDPDDNWAHRGRFGLVEGEPFSELPAALRPRGDLASATERFVRGLVVRRKLRAVGKWLKGEPITRSPFVKPSSHSDHVVLDRAASVRKHGVDTSVAAARAYHDPDQPDAWRARLSLQRALLDQLLRELKQRGVRVAVLYIPNSHLFRFGGPPARLAARNPHSALLREACEANAVPLFDGVALLSTAADPVGLYFAHDGHLNRSGHAHLAASLADPLAHALER